MTDTKVRLSLCVPGAQLLSEQECSKNPKESYNTEILVIETKSKKGKKPEYKKFVIKTRKQRTAKQCLNISREAYDYMVNPDNPPTAKFNKRVYLKKVVGKKADGSLIKKTIESTVWAETSLKKRLEWHLGKIAESLRALSFTYEIFED